MAEHQLSALTMLTEFFAAEQIEAAARRTGFVKRASKITGKTFWLWSPSGPGVMPKRPSRNWRRK